MINEMREDGYQVTELCAAFELSKSSYYAARKRPPSKRAKENEVIVSKIKEIHEDRHLKVYGSPRMTTELQVEHGLSCSENRVARLMAKNGLQARYKAAFRPKTTTEDPTQKASPNILANTEPPSVPGQVCVSDITYVATREGWLYLAVVIDLYSRAVVGWSVAETMRTFLVTSALAETMHTFLVTSALAKAMSNLPQGTRPLFHSDRGCQYTSKAFRKVIALYGLPQSMSAKGYCYGVPRRMNGSSFNCARDGSLASRYRSAGTGIKPPGAAVFRKGMVVSDHGKGVLKTSGRNQGDERKRTTDHASKFPLDVVRIGGRSNSKISPRETCLLLGRQPVYRWHDLDSGSCMERGNLFSDAKGNPQAVDPARENTNAENRDGAARSSVEASVMEVERRCCIIQLETWDNLETRRIS